MGSATDDTTRIEYVSSCPRCGICPDCKAELREETTLNETIARTMSARAYQRGLGRGFAVGAMCGALLIFVMWYAVHSGVI